MAGTADYIRTLREQKAQEAGLPGLESDLASAESGLADRISAMPGQIESTRSQLADSQYVKDLESQMATGEQELQKHYFRLKEDTFNPQSQNYIFANPVAVERLVAENLAPERASQNQKGLARERYHEENKEFLANFSNYLQTMIEGEKAKVSAKDSAYKRALQKVADTLDLEFKIFDENKPKGTGSGGYSDKTAYEFYDVDTVSKANAMIDQMKKDGKSEAEISNELEMAGLDHNKFIGSYKGTLKVIPYDEETGFTSGNLGDSAVIEQPQQNIFQRAYSKIFGGQ